MSLSGHRHLLRALCWLAWCSRQTSGARLDRTRRGRCGAAVGNIGAPAAAQRLWFWCKPLGYRQDRLEMRLNQPHDRMPPLRVPILTKMVVSASVASVLYALLLETTSEQQRAAAVHHSHVHRVHHVRGGADDVSGLLIAALTASTRANRPWQRRPGLQAPAIRWQPEELLLVSGCSGHADRSRPDVDAAASCSYLSDCMSLSGHRHLLRALCWLAWCCCVPFACASRASRAERS